MTENIMKDNLLYLEAWMNYNPRLKENLSIDKNILVYKNNEQTEQIDISNFYLPEMLYNENFRIKVQKELNAEDLFQIIKIYVQTEEILKEEQKEQKMSPKIKDLIIKKEMEKEFIVFIDEFDKKYRYDTTNLEQVINFYNELKEKNGVVTLKEIGSVIQNGN